MFYAPRALLLTKDIRRSKHSGGIAAFNEHVIRSGTARHELFISLRDAFDDPSEGDYGLVTISMEQGRASVDAAREFVKELSDLLPCSAE